MTLNELMQTGFPVMAPLWAVIVLAIILDNKKERQRLNKR